MRACQAIRTAFPEGVEQTKLDASESSRLASNVAKGLLLHLASRDAAAAGLAALVAIADLEPNAAAAGAGFACVTQAMRAHASDASLQLLGCAALRALLKK